MRRQETRWVWFLVLLGVNVNDGVTSSLTGVGDELYREENEAKIACAMTKQFWKEILKISPTPEDFMRAFLNVVDQLFQSWPSAEGEEQKSAVEMKRFLASVVDNTRCFLEQCSHHSAILRLIDESVSEEDRRAFEEIAQTFNIDSTEVDVMILYALLKEKVDIGENEIKPTVMDVLRQEVDRRCQVETREHAFEVADEVKLLEDQ